MSLAPQVKQGDAFSRMNIRLEKLAYSPYVDVSPLAWQTPNGVIPQAVWSVKDPLVLTDLGGWVWAVGWWWWGVG